MFSDVFRMLSDILSAVVFNMGLTILVGLVSLVGLVGLVSLLGLVSRLLWVV